MTYDGTITLQAAAETPALTLTLTMQDADGAALNPQTAYAGYELTAEADGPAVPTPVATVTGTSTATEVTFTLTAEQTAALVTTAQAAARVVVAADGSDGRLGPRAVYRVRVAYGAAEAGATVQEQAAAWTLKESAVESTLFTGPGAPQIVSRMPDRYLDDIVRRQPTGVTSAVPGEALRTAIAYAASVGTRKLILEPSESLGATTDADGRRIADVDRPITTNLGGVQMVIEAGVRLKMRADATNPEAANALITQANVEGFELHCSPESILDGNQGALPDYGQGGSTVWGSASQPARKVFGLSLRNARSCYVSGFLRGENCWAPLFLTQYEHVRVDVVQAIGVVTDDDNDTSGFSNLTASALQFGESKAFLSLGGGASVGAVYAYKVSDAVDFNPIAQGIQIGLIDVAYANEGGFETSGLVGARIDQMIARNCTKAVNNEAYNFGSFPVGTFENMLDTAGEASPGVSIGQVTAIYDADWFGADGVTPVLTNGVTPIALVLREGCHIESAVVILRDVPGVVIPFEVHGGSSIGRLKIIGDATSTLAGPALLRGGRVNIEKLLWANVAGQPAIRVTAGGSRLDLAAPEPINDAPTSAAVDYAVTEDTTRVVRSTVEAVSASAAGTATLETNRDSSNFTVGNLLPTVTTPWTPTRLGSVLWTPNGPFAVDGETLTLTNSGGLQGQFGTVTLGSLAAARHPANVNGKADHGAGDILAMVNPQSGGGFSYGAPTLAASREHAFAMLLTIDAALSGQVRLGWSGGNPWRLELYDNAGTPNVRLRIDDAGGTTYTVELGAWPVGTEVALGVHVTASQVEVFRGVDGSGDPVSVGTQALAGGLEATSGWANNFTLNGASPTNADSSTGEITTDQRVFAPLAVDRADMLRLVQFVAGVTVNE